MGQSERVSTEQSSRMMRARLVLAGFGWRVFLRRYRWPLIVSTLAVGLALALVAVIILATTSSGTKAAPIVPLQVYALTAAAVPENHVQGSGRATVQLRGSILTVDLETKG